MLGVKEGDLYCFESHGRQVFPTLIDNFNRMENENQQQAGSCICKKLVQDRTWFVEQAAIALCNFGV